MSFLSPFKDNIRQPDKSVQPKEKEETEQRSGVPSAQLDDECLETPTDGAGLLDVRNDATDKCKKDRRRQPVFPPQQTSTSGDGFKRPPQPTTERGDGGGVGSAFD